MALDIYAIKRELVIFLRNSIIDTHVPARTTRNIEYFSGNNSQTQFELTEDISRNGNHLVKNIISVDVNGVSQTEFTDWTFTYQSDSSSNVGVMEFATAPDNSSANNIEISYDWGLNWIFTDLPRTEISPKNLPRVSIELLSAPSDEISLGAQVLKSPVRISITIVANSTFELDSLTAQIRNAILNNRTNFNFGDTRGIITDPTISPTIIAGDAEAYIFQRTLDWTIPDIYEFFSGTC